MEQLVQLYEYTKKIGGTCAHLEMGGLFQDPRTTGVLAVYIGERPAHRILEDLEVWAEAHGEERILDIIEQISQPGYMNPWKGGGAHD